MKWIGHTPLLDAPPSLSPLSRSSILSLSFSPYHISIFILPYSCICHPAYLHISPYIIYIHTIYIYMPCIYSLTTRGHIIITKKCSLDSVPSNVTYKPPPHPPSSLISPSQPTLLYHHCSSIGTATLLVSQYSANNKWMNNHLVVYSLHSRPRKEVD